MISRRNYDLLGTSHGEPRVVQEEPPRYLRDRLCVCFEPFAASGRRAQLSEQSESPQAPSPSPPAGATATDPQKQAKEQLNQASEKWIQDWS